MKKRSLLFTLLACLFTIGQAKDYSDYVNPLVGTQSTFELSTGNTYPAIARPWGMKLLDASNRKNGRWLAIYLYCNQNPRLQANPPAQPVDKRLRTILHHADGEQT